MEEIDYSLDNLKSLIGQESHITSQIIQKLKLETSLPPEFLPVLSLLLIENRFSVVEVITSILLSNPGLVDNYINSLQGSKYYNQRCAVPRIIKHLPNTTSYLKRALKDDTGLVVKEAVSLLPHGLSDNELLEVALHLNNHQYEYIQCLVPDVLIHIKQNTFLLNEISLAKSWRKRLSLVHKISFFKEEVISVIFNIMYKDPEEQIRIALVEHVHLSLDYAELFIKDKSELVRSKLIKCIGNTHPEILDHVLNDPSWLVKKELLCIHREDIYERISLPIIRSLPSSLNWRIKIEILETILHIVTHNDLLVKRCLLDTLFNYLSDSVYEVRKKAGEVLKLLIRVEWSYDLKNKMMEGSYLVRITMVESFLAFDKNDKVINVRMRVLNVLRREDINEEMVDIIKNMTDDSKEDVERLIK